MPDKPALSWYPTTIEELQRLLDSGVWPRVRAIADDVGPLQIAQGRLTYIDIEKDGMSGILREGPAPAGAEPFDLTSRSLWIWRAESTEPAKREYTMVLRLDKPPCFEPASDEIKGPEFTMPPNVAGVDFCVVELDDGGWRMEASCDDPGGPLGPECVVRGEDRDSKAEAVVDAWEYAFGLWTSQSPRDAEAEVERLADYLLRHHASECAGPGASAVCVAIGLLRSAGEDRRRLAAALADRDELQRAVEARKADLALGIAALRRIAAASNLAVTAAHGPEFAMELAGRVEKQLALLSPVLRTDDEQHAVSRAVDALQRIARAVGLNRYADDVFTILQASDTIAGRVELRLRRHSDAFERIAAASGYQTLQGLDATDYDHALAERVEQQFADFRKVADRICTEREIAGAAEQLVRRLVDHLVETDPEYIEQLRRGGS